MAGLGFTPLSGGPGGGATLLFDARDLEHYLQLLSLAGRNTLPLLRRIGHVVQSVAQDAIQKADYKPKPPIWEIWEGGKTAPLTYRGRLLGSITVDADDVRGSVRVGSPLAYAATQQFGSDGPRGFYVYIVPEYEEGKRGQRVKRDEATGYPIGLLRLKQGKNTIKTLVIQTIEPRPFLPEEITPSMGAQMHAIAHDYLLGVDRRAA